MLRTSVSLALALLLPACASVTSVPGSDESLGDGLTYYLPKKDILLTVVVADKGVTTVSIGTTAAYPDLTRQFVLRSERNAVGKIVNNVGVDSNGLLTSTKSTATSGVSDALRNLAESVGSFGPMIFRESTVPVSCGVGTHTFIYASKTANGMKACGLDVSVARMPLQGAEAAPTADARPARSSGVAYSGAYAGLYYRQSEPYLVTVTGAINTAGIIFSPSDAPLKRLPVARTFFANGEAELEFTDGVPTKYNQSLEGEVVALLKLPATVIAAYFSAIGGLFDAFKARDAKQADELAASVRLDLAKAKYSACVKAIQDRDDALIAKLECGK